MIKVLVVDDSGVARELIAHILSGDPNITVIGTAKDGVEAVEAVARLKPDVVTMDIIMPKMDGYKATRQIMETNPVPIVIVTASLVQEEVENTWRSVEAGAVAVLQKPGFFDKGRPGGAADKLVQTVKVVSEVKVVRRWTRRPAPGATASPPPPPRPPRPAEVAAPVPGPTVRMVAIGSSTGGPSVLQTILSGLPGDFPVPVTVVQHISPGFTAGFVDWLNQTSGLKVQMGGAGQVALPGNVYVAPDGLHMKVDNRCRISTTSEDEQSTIRPSVACLFRSVAEAFGEKAVGVLLTGMGRDGAAELKMMRDRGAVTIAQDKETCVVFGMPGEAVKLGAARYTLPPPKIADMLNKLVKAPSR